MWLNVAWSNFAETANTNMLRNPVRYCGIVMVSPGFKMSWKYKKSTNKNPTINVIARSLFMLLL